MFTVGNYESFLTTTKHTFHIRLHSLVLGQEQRTFSMFLLTFHAGNKDKVHFPWSGSLSRTGTGIKYTFQVLDASLGQGHGKVHFPCSGLSSWTGTGTTYTFHCKEGHFNNGLSHCSLPATYMSSIGKITHDGLSVEEDDSPTSGIVILPETEVKEAGHLVAVEVFVYGDVDQSLSLKASEKAAIIIPKRRFVFTLSTLFACNVDGVTVMIPFFLCVTNCAPD